MNDLQLSCGLTEAGLLGGSSGVWFAWFGCRWDWKRFQSHRKTWWLTGKCRTDN